jgi:hypothetical protein
VNYRNNVAQGAEIAKSLFGVLPETALNNLAALTTRHKVPLVGEPPNGPNQIDLVRRPTWLHPL